MQNYIYLIQDNTYYKIGETNKLPKSRLKELQTGNPRLLKLIYEYKCNDSKKLEFLLHRYFHNKHILNEWFELDKEDVEEFLKICDKLNTNLSVLNENHYFKNKIYR